MVDIRESPRALRGREHDPAAERTSATAPSAAVDVPFLVKNLTEYDIPWLNFICKKRYSNRYDSDTTENWFRNIVLKSPLTFHATRSENAFQISMLSIMPWLPAEPECSVIFACADEGKGWEVVKLMRESIEWARKRRCAMWRLASDTEAEFEMLAKRLGCDQISPRYVIRF